MMPGIIIRDHITAEDIEHIIARHRILYEREFGFDSTFGDYVARSLQEKPERIWISEHDGKFAGCVGLVEPDDQTAQLRWFLVEPEMRGMGIGKELMQKFMDYCNAKQYEQIFLWTVNKLPAARSIYERYGFQLTEEKPEKMLWGQNLIEQRWDLSLKRNR
jgi:N-acetylglutamate synthase-like GNAT family acetyltransferase